MSIPKIDFAAKRKTVIVEIPELEGSVTLRALSRKQLDGLDGEKNNTTNILALSIVDPSTLQRLYVTDEDVANLGEMSLTASKLLQEAVGLLNGFSQEAIDEAAKKSEASPSTDSE